jgi:putative transposase
MARKPRVEAPGAIHHVVTRGVGDRPIVRDDIDRMSFVHRLARAVELHGWRCWAYCLMDTHFHLVIQTPEPNLGVGMKWLKATHTQDFHHRHESRDHLFGGRYFSEIIRHERHLIEACAYVVLNPVRAGLVAEPELWPWSSYRLAAGVENQPRSLVPFALLELFDADRSAARERFVAAVELVLDRDRIDPWDQTRGV